MDFTFGICATKENAQFHPIVIESIKSLGIPNYEILFVDNECEPPPILGVKHITYNASLDMPGWITKKKNLIAQYARYDNIVFLHDYIYFIPGWYQGFLGLSSDFDVCMNIIANSNGTRFRDWCLNPFEVIPPKGPITNREFLLPYSEDRLTDRMYVSGTYWVAKKDFMLENPLDENRTWGESEDIEWSQRVMPKAKYIMNSKSQVQCLKHKYFDFTDITEENILKLL